MATTAPLHLQDDDTFDRLFRPRPRPAAPTVDRTAGELDLAHRIALADRIHALVVDAERVNRCATTPQRTHRAQVLDARGRLAAVEYALRSGMPLFRRGEQLVARLVSGDTSGAYCHGDVHALHRDADTACAALGLVTPFH